jgi:hypothetical protein
MSQQILAKHNYDPDIVSPEHVQSLTYVPLSSRGTRPQEDARMLSELPDEALFDVTWTRPELATDAIRINPRLILLGKPGAGKSTVLRYLALLLAQKAQEQPVDLVGWNDDYLPVPVLCPLGAVAEVLRTEQPDPDVVVRSLLALPVRSIRLRSGSATAERPSYKTGTAISVLGSIRRSRGGALKGYGVTV